MWSTRSITANPSLPKTRTEKKNSSKFAENEVNEVGRYENGGDQAAKIAAGKADKTAQLTKNQDEKDTKIKTHRPTKTVVSLQKALKY